MTKRNTNTYWLLLTGILLLVSAAMLIRPTRSHYINTTVWNTALYAEESAVPAGNCLVKGGETILLGKLSTQTDETGAAVASQYPFTLIGTMEDLNLSVNYSDGSAVSYLTAAVTAEQNESGSIDAVLTLTPDLTVAHPEVTADITVTWTVEMESFSSVFQITVPEVTVAAEKPDDTTTDGTEETGGETGTDTGETTQPTEETPAAAATTGAVVLTVTAPGTYDTTGLLPVHIGVEGTVNAIYLGKPKTNEDGTVTMGELPAFTRYSVDGGTSWTLLYGGGLIELTEGGTVLLDLTRTGLELTASQTLYVQAYTEESLAQQAEFTAVAAAILPQERVVTPRVVTASDGTQISLPGQWKDAELTWTVSGRNADGTYTPIEDLTAIGLTVEKITGESGDTLNIQLTPESGVKPAPGTYKLRLQWSWQSAGFAETELTFFVNYVVDAQG